MLGFSHVSFDVHLLHIPLFSTNSIVHRGFRLDIGVPLFFDSKRERVRLTRARTTSLNMRANIKNFPPQPEKSAAGNWKRPPNHSGADLLRAHAQIEDLANAHSLSSKFGPSISKYMHLRKFCCSCFFYWPSPQ